MKKKYYNPAWRKVSLTQAQRATAIAAESGALTPLQVVQQATENKLRNMKTIVHESALSGHKCYHELNTPTVIRDIFAIMTPEEFQGYIDRLYPNPETAENVPG